MKKSLLTILMVFASVTLASADLPDSGDYDQTYASLSAGYYWVETDDNSGRAAEYKYQDVSGTASFDVRSGGASDFHYMVDGNFINENDYLFSGHFDSGNLFRFNVRMEKLFHNLDHIDYDARPTAAGGSTSSVNFNEQNPGDVYSLKVDMSEVTARVKLPDMPAHFNISYWRFHKDGMKQLRYVNKDCSGCHLESKSKEIDRTTHQVTGAVDAHLGHYDLILKHTYRELVIDDPIQVDAFGNIFGGRRTPGSYQHDAEPESQLNESTIELHSSLAGGVNIAASGTYGKRKNRSQVTDVAPIYAETEYYKAAAEITHTTSPKFSYNFRARYLDMDSENTADKYPSLDVRRPIDLQRASYEINTTCRPSKKVSYVANVQFEQIKRTETGDPAYFHSGAAFMNDPVWEVPEEELKVRAKLGLLARPLSTSKFKVNGNYTYQYSDDPAYGSSFENSHQVLLATSYSVNPKWGFNISARGILETNDETRLSSSDDDSILLADVERERQLQSANFGTWVVLGQDVTAGLNYGYHRTAIKQDLFYRDHNVDVFVAGTEDVDYLQEVHTVSGNISFVLAKRLKANLGGYYTRSIGFYDPDFNDPGFVSPADSIGLKDATHYDIDQYGGKASIDYYITPDLELTMSYTYDDYDEKYTDDFDGSVQTAMASLGYRW